MKDDQRESLLAWQRERLCENAALALAGRGYLASVARSAEEARAAALAQIPEGASVGLGGSMTIERIGLLEALRSERYRLIDRYAARDPGERTALYREALLSDVFVTGVNAITRAGELVFRDSSGNRAAAAIFGPERLVVVAGANKLVADLAEAEARMRRIAPLNCRRLGHATPCAESGECADCAGGERMCNYTAVIHHGFKEKGRIRIILVSMDLGF